MKPFRLAGFLNFVLSPSSIALLAWHPLSSFVDRDRVAFPGLVIAVDVDLGDASALEHLLVCSLVVFVFPAAHAAFLEEGLPVTVVIIVSQDWSMSTAVSITADESVSIVRVMVVALVLVVLRAVSPRSSLVVIAPVIAFTM